MEGSRAFVRAHRKEFDRETTYFLNIEAAAGEVPTWSARARRSASRWTGG